MNPPKIDPAGQEWRSMTVNSEATLETYRLSSHATREETRHVLDRALSETDQQSLEGQALAYLIGRLDEIDAGETPSSSQNE